MDRFHIMTSPLHRVAHIISWVISPVVVAPAVYAAVVMLGFGHDARHIYYLSILFVASTLLPVIFITWLKQRGKISDFNISLRQQRYQPLLLITLVNAAGCSWIMASGAPPLLSGILLFNSVNTVILLLVTLQWKISIHLFTLTSAIALLFMQFGFPAFWLLPVVPLLMWSRIRLKAHNFMQTLVGGLIGFMLMLAELKWWTGS